MAVAALDPALAAQKAELVEKMKESQVELSEANTEAEINVASKKAKDALKEVDKLDKTTAPKNKTIEDRATKGGTPSVESPPRHFYSQDGKDKGDLTNFQELRSNDRLYSKNGANDVEEIDPAELNALEKKMPPKEFAKLKKKLRLSKRNGKWGTTIRENTSKAAMDGKVRDAEGEFQGMMNRLGAGSGGAELQNLIGQMGGGKGSKSDGVSFLTGATVVGGALSITNGTDMGNIAGFAGGAAIAGFANTMGLEGLAFSAKKIMRGQLARYQDRSMSEMINNPGIPIEDLIFYFMAFMSEKYENKLREKMEEARIAETRERERELTKDTFRMAGGILSAGAMGAGTLAGGLMGGMAAMQAGQTITMMADAAANRVNAVRDALNGNAKSSTILMSEVQILMQKWKQLTEMLSNMSKNLHDLAMAPIRNLR